MCARLHLNAPEAAGANMQGRAEQAKKLGQPQPRRGDVDIVLHESDIVWICDCSCIDG